MRLCLDGELSVKSAFLRMTLGLDWELSVKLAFLRMPLGGYDLKIIYDYEKDNLLCDYGGGDGLERCC